MYKILFLLSIILFLGCVADKQINQNQSDETKISVKEVKMLYFGATW